MEEGGWYRKWKVLFKAFFLRGKSGEPLHASEEEVETLIDAGTESGFINEEEGEMIHGIFDLKNTLVREVMVPRTEIVAIAGDSTVRDLVELVRKETHSRYPVYQKNIDNVIGVIHVKDIVSRGDGGIDSPLKNFIRQLFIVPETKNVEELLKEFKKKGTHIALVVDEFGGTSGIITIEDIIEEIVGEIRDEYDLEEVKIIPQPDGSQTVDARLDIDELESFLGIEIAGEEFETVGGLLSFLIGRVPRTGDVVSSAGLKFTVLSADEKKALMVRVEREEEKIVEKEAGD